MQCFRPHNNYFESHIIGKKGPEAKNFPGCAIGKLGIRLEEFAQLADTSFVQCRETELGAVALHPVSVDGIFDQRPPRTAISALSCRLDNRTFPHDAKWEDGQRAARMHCSFGHLLKTGCLLDGQEVPIGQELNISNGCVFLCHPKSSVYICDTKLGDYKPVP